MFLVSIEILLYLVVFSSDVNNSFLNIQFLNFLFRISFTHQVEFFLLSVFCWSFIYLALFSLTPDLLSAVNGLTT